MTVPTSPPPLSLPRGLFYLSIACTVSALVAFVVALLGAEPLPLPVLFALPALVLAWCVRRWMAPAPVPDRSEGDSSA